MISNERNPHGRQSSRDRFQDKPTVQEDTLGVEKIQIERKSFAFALKENPRGRFLRITEDVGGRRATMIVPAPGLEEFRRVLDGMIKLAGELKPWQGEGHLEDEREQT